MNKYITIAIILSITAILYSCKHDDRDFDQEMAELKEFILKKEAEGLNIDTAGTGIFYILKNEGAGPTPQEGDTCYIEYQCYSLNDRLIEQSLDIYPPNGIWKFIFAPDDMIQGLRTGINLMNAECEMDIIIPSNLAFGKAGTANIPPYTTLIYVVKMYDVRVRNN